MLFITNLIIALFVFHCTCLAEDPSYIGEAYADGELAYTERHYLKYDQAGKLKTATTLYFDRYGKEIAKLDSDFTTSLTSPDHTLKNMISGNIQGVRREENQTVLFSKNASDKERSRVVNQDDEVRTLMGCQGLNYYLLENLDKLASIKVLPIRFLIPGKLDYYDFTVNYVGETEPGKIDFEINIDSWFLSIFASSLKVQYDKKLKRISRYEGLSNIPDKNGKPQNVLINYSAPLS